MFAFKVNVEASALGKSLIHSIAATEGLLPPGENQLQHVKRDCFGQQKGLRELFRQLFSLFKAWVCDSGRGREPVLPM